MKTDWAELDQRLEAAEIEAEDIREAIEAEYVWHPTINNGFDGLPTEEGWYWCRYRGSEPFHMYRKLDGGIYTAWYVERTTWHSWGGRQPEEWAYLEDYPHENN